MDTLSSRGHLMVTPALRHRYGSASPCMGTLPPHRPQMVAPHPGTPAPRHPAQVGERLNLHGHPLLSWCSDGHTNTPALGECMGTLPPHCPLMVTPALGTPTQVRLSSSTCMGTLPPHCPLMVTPEHARSPSPLTSLGVASGQQAEGLCLPEGRDDTASLNPLVLTLRHINKTSKASHDSPK